MRGIWRFVFAGSALSILLVGGAALVRVAVAGPQGSGYHQVKRITLGGEGRWDYFAVEQGTHRIFIPRGTTRAIGATTSTTLFLWGKFTD